MSNFYKSDCCGAEVQYHGDDIYHCLKCGELCEVTAVLDTPGGVPEDIKQYQEDIKAGVEVSGKTDLQRKLFDLFENSGWSGVLNTLGQRSKEEVIGVILNDVEDLLSEQRQSIIEEVEKLIDTSPILDEGNYIPKNDYELARISKAIGKNQALDTVIKIINK